MSTRSATSADATETARRANAAFKVWINGTLHEKQDAKISVYDHGLLYGDGVFEGLRSYGGKVFSPRRPPGAAVELGQGDFARDSRLA